MKFTKAILGALLVGTFASGCAELEDSNNIGIHPSDWSTPGSANNHAAALADAGLPGSVRDCGGCHGADYGRRETECFVCHARGAEAGHAPREDFTPPTGSAFHGQDVIDAQGVGACAGCHSWEAGGELDFDLGGWSQIACNTCHAGGVSGHPGMSVWFDPTSPQFHGVAAAGAGLAECSQCHGVDYLGGWAEVSCNTCHPSGAPIHPDDWIGASTSEGSHGYLILEDNGLDEEDCRACHGSDLEGGWTGQDCRPCHGEFYPPPRS